MVKLSGRMRLLRLASVALFITVHFLPAVPEKTRTPGSFEDAVKDFVSDWDRRHPSKNQADVAEPPDSASVEESDNFTLPDATDPDNASLDDNGETVAENGYSYPGEDGPGSRNCTRCVPHEEAKAMRIAAIKAQILDRLRLSHPPNVTRKMMLKLPPVNDYLNRLNGGTGNHMMMSDSPELPYGPRHQELEDDDEYHLNTEKVISLAQSAPSWKQPKHMGSVYFNFAPNILSMHVARAHLWVPINSQRIFTDRTPARLYVYQVFRSKGKNNLTKLNLFKDWKVDSSLVKDGWFTVDLRKLVIQWFRRPEENFGLVIHLNDPEGEQLPVFDPADQENRPAPFIEVRVETPKLRRKKRNLGLTCQENSPEVKCCRYPLTVDFEEFGWDWVIAPKRYEANYCSGECPYVFLQTYPHTHLVTQAKSPGSTGPCCAPRKLSQINMLYFNPEQSNIVLGMLPNMVVEKCGCE